ncbi:MAG TPA: nuclear transport factor 2 family protein [Chloroflexia bacterium]|nr:nuclear transport factor 2 family protein [Chloroflexia bacterium]
MQTAETATVEQNMAVIRRLYEAFGRGDVPAVLAEIAPDATWVNPYGKGHFPGQWGQPCRGHAEIGAFLKAINEAVEVRGFEPYEMIAQGDKVVVLINWKGVVRQTGQPYETLLVHIWTLRAGQVVDYIGLDDATVYPF